MHGKTPPTPPLERTANRLDGLPIVRRRPTAAAKAHLHTDDCLPVRKGTAKLSNWRKTSASTRSASLDQGSTREVHPQPSRCLRIQLPLDCRSNPPLHHFIAKRFFPQWFVIASLAWTLGCDPRVDVRVYDAPKTDTQFVAGPMAGQSSSVPVAGTSSAPSNTAGPRRILGAVIPMESGCYFLKATDAPETLEPLLSDFLDIVSKFSISASSGKPEMELPSGWVMNPRNDIAMAEFVSPSSKGNVKFTVTVLGMPSASEWTDYLLSNINRWRGQLKLPELDAKTLPEELISVERSGSLLPGYIFDAVGTGTGGMSGPRPPMMSDGPRSGPSASDSTRAAASPSPSAPAEGTPPGVAPPPAGSPSTAPVAPRERPELQYETPSGWVVAAGSPFRLATFNIESAEGPGEVTVSMAVDNPAANSMMWFQQVTREADESKLKPLVEQSIQNAEKLASSTREATLYTIRDSEQIDAPVLLVASIPSEEPELNLFVKLRGDNRLVQSQRDNFLQFVKSLSLK
jgi:hypothetical protein